MDDRDLSSYLDVAKAVFDDDAKSGDAIEQLVLRTNDSLTELGASFYFRCGGEHVFKELVES
jgi:hypothetical protein